MIGLSNLAVIIPQFLPIIYDYLKIKGIIKVKGYLKEIVQKPEFQQKFLNDSDNNIIVNIEGDVYLGDFSRISNDTKGKLLSGLKLIGEEKPGKDVDIFAFDFYQRVLAFSKTKIHDKHVSKYLKYVKSSDIQNLFYLSRYVEILFNKGDSSEANKVRSDIGRQYGKFGRKFCNLYQQKYIFFLIEHLVSQYGNEDTELEKIFESEIRHFVDYSDPIFFINQYTDKKEIYSRCKYLINKEVDYIALHAGGETNIKIAREIRSKLKDTLIEKNYDIKEETIESKTKTHLLNIYMINQKD